MTDRPIVAALSPAGVAIQDPELRKRLDFDQSVERLARFLEASVALMQVLARACGHCRFGAFTPGDLTTWKRDMALLSGLTCGGVLPRG